MTTWDLALVAAKWLIYLGQAAATGGVLMAAAAAALHPGETALRRSLSRRLLAVGSLGLAAVAASFFLHTGAFADAGFRGMFDRDLLPFLWDSPIGSSAVLRGLGIALPLAALMLGPLAATTAGSVLVYLVFCVPGLLLTGLSFTQVGHVAELDGLRRGLLALHVVLALSWAGALYPLWLACARFPPGVLRNIMHGFGSLALWLVPALLAAGVALLLALLDTPWELFTTPYGLVFLLKLLLVLAVLLLAALHRWRLVPALAGPHSCMLLRRSLAGEALLVAIVLLVTALLSSVLGPG